MAELEKEILSEIELKPYPWWRFIDNIFFLWEHEEKKLNKFIEHLNKKHSAIKFAAEWSQTLINLLDNTVSLIGGTITTDLYVKATDSHQYLHSSLSHPYHRKREFHTAKLFALIEFVQILFLLIEHVMILKSG